MKKYCWWIFGLLLVFLPEVLAEPGRITFSDGKVVEGNITMTSGRKLRLSMGKSIKDIALNEVAGISIFPKDEKMVQKWTFPEAGRARKEKYGKPYPLRNLSSKITMRDGRTFSGHLFTTGLQVKSKDKGNSKLVIYSKQRGKEGETLEGLIYPKEIIFSVSEQKTVKNNFRFSNPSEGELEFEVLTCPGLINIPFKKNGICGFEFETDAKMRCFPAFKVGDEITVSWTEEQKKALFDLVKKYLVEVKDFFDSETLLAVDEYGDEVFSLVMLRRKGRTTLEKKESLPWRLVVFRWKYDKQENKLLLSGRGCLFRGLIAKGGKIPAVKIVPEDKFSLKDQDE